MTFEKLTKGDALAWVAALALLFVTAIDWWSTKLGDAARQIEHDVQVPGGPLGSDIPNTIKQQAALVANAQEKNLWQTHGAIDRLILIVLLATALCATIAAVMRVAEYRFNGSLTPSAITAVLAGLGVLLVLYRLVQQPGFDEATVVKAGPWLALACLGLIGLGASLAWRAEHDGTAWKEGPKPAGPDQAAHADPV